MRQIFVKQSMSALTLVWAQMLIESLTGMLAGRGMVGFVGVKAERIMSQKPKVLRQLIWGTSSR